MVTANDNADAAMLEQFEIETIIRGRAANVTQLRFGKKIKLSKHAATLARPAGWMLLVEGPVGGFIMNASDGFLYHTQGRDGSDPFNDAQFTFTSLLDAVNMAEALEANLDESQQVVDPKRAFMSRFLNPVTFERQAAYWASEECAIGPVLSR